MICPLCRQVTGVSAPSCLKLNFALMEVLRDLPLIIPFEAQTRQPHSLLPLDCPDASMQTEASLPENSAHWVPHIEVPFFTAIPGGDETACALGVWSLTSPGAEKRHIATDEMESNIFGSSYIISSNLSGEGIANAEAGAVSLHASPSMSASLSSSDLISHADRSSAFALPLSYVEEPPLSQHSQSRTLINNKQNGANSRANSTMGGAVVDPQSTSSAWQESQMETGDIESRKRDGRSVTRANVVRERFFRVWCALDRKEEEILRNIAAKEAEKKEQILAQLDCISIAIDTADAVLKDVRRLSGLANDALLLQSEANMYLRRASHCLNDLTVAAGRANPSCSSLALKHSCEGDVDVDQSSRRAKGI